MILRLLNRLIGRPDITDCPEFQFTARERRFQTIHDTKIFLNHIDRAYFYDEKKYEPWDMVVERIVHYKEWNIFSAHEYLEVSLFSRRDGKEVRGTVFIERGKKRQVFRRYKDQQKKEKAAQERREVDPDASDDEADDDSSEYSLEDLFSAARDKVIWGSTRIFRHAIQSIDMKEPHLSAGWKKKKGKFYTDEEWEALKKEATLAESETFYEAGKYQHGRLNFLQLVVLAEFLHTKWTLFDLANGQWYWYADILIKLVRDRTGNELKVGPSVTKQGQWKGKTFYTFDKYAEDYKGYLGESYRSRSVGQLEFWGKQEQAKYQEVMKQREEAEASYQQAKKERMEAEEAAEGAKREREQAEERLKE